MGRDLGQGDWGRGSFLPYSNQADVVGTCNRLQSMYLTLGVYIFIDLFITSLFTLFETLG